MLFQIDPNSPASWSRDSEGRPILSTMVAFGIQVPTGPPETHPFLIAEMDRDKASMVLRDYLTSGRTMVDRFMQVWIDLQRDLNQWSDDRHSGED